MWVWSDELADRFPAIHPGKRTGLPLIAYSVEREIDLEAFAREVLVGSHRPDEVPPSDPGGAATREG